MTSDGFRGGNSDRVAQWVRSAVRCRRNQHGCDRTRVRCEFAVVCGKRLGRLAAHPAHEAVPGTAQHASHNTQHATQHAHVCCTARQSLGTGRVARRTTASALLQRSLPYTLATHAAAGRNGRSHPVRPQSHVGCCAAVHCTCTRSAPLRVACVAVLTSTLRDYARYSASTLRDVALHLHA